MHRCLANPGDWSQSAARLSSEETHHLVHVLRLGRGADVAVFDGLGREAIGSIVEIGHDQAVIGNLRDVRVSNRDIDLSLIIALPKGNRMDCVVEKATELGVASIRPVISERVVARPSGEQLESRRMRWQRIAVSGAKQSGSPWVPEIRPIVSLAEALNAAVPGFDVFFAGVIGEDTQPLRNAVCRAVRKRPRRVGLLIGPEGDLTGSEVEAAVKAGAVAVSFGPRVLRVETAALYGLSVLAYEFTSPAAGEV